MTENELEGAATRRVWRQAGEVLNKELNVLYADRRDDALTIATKNNSIGLLSGEVETLKKINRDLEGQVSRDRARMNQECWITDFTIYFGTCGWIAAFVAIGYGVWVG